MRKVTVVSPNFKRPDLVASLIENLNLQQEIEIEIIVVDDCSNDGSVEKIRKDFPNIRVFVNEKNSGPTVARNKGILAASNELIIGIDSDVTLPDPLTLKKLADKLYSLPEKHGIALRVLTADGTQEDTPRWWHPRPIEKYANIEFETDYFSGTAFAFWKKDLIEIGMFQENIFQYYEENLLAARFIESGGTLIYSPEFKVFHHVGVRPAYSNHRLYHNPRSQVIFAYHALPNLRCFWFLLSRLSSGLLRSIKNKGLSLYFKGVRDGFKTCSSHPEIRKPLSKDSLRRIRAIRNSA